MKLREGEQHLLEVIGFIVTDQIILEFPIPGRYALVFKDSFTCYMKEEAS